MQYLNNKGYSLLLTILTIFLVSIIGLSLLTITANSNKITTHERQDQSVYYIAEAGINLEKAKITDILTELYNSLTDKLNQLDYEEQEALLNSYGSFDNYFSNNINDQFCSKYNTITGSQKCSFKSEISGIEYENSYSFSKQFNDTPVAKTTIKGIHQKSAGSNNTTYVFTLQSEGYFENAKKNSRVLTQTLTVDIDAPSPGGGGQGESAGDGTKPPSVSNPLSNIAAITNGNIILENGPKINGNAGSLNGSISLIEGAEITGTVAVSPEKFIYPSWMGDLSSKITDTLNIKLEDYLPDFPHDTFENFSNIDYPQNVEVAADDWNKTYVIENGSFKADNWITKNYRLSLSNDVRFDNFIVDQDNTITIDIGNKDVNLYVNSLNIKQGHIKITGTGKLNIYVKDFVNIKGSFNSSGDPNKVNIFYQGTNPTTFGGETQLYGSFYTNSADLELTGGAGLYGNIYSGGKKININGGISTKGQYIIAPHADLKLEGGGNITGMVIANSIHAVGGVSINYGTSIVPSPSIPGASNNPLEFYPANSLIKESVLNET